MALALRPHANCTVKLPARSWLAHLSNSKPTLAFDTAPRSTRADAKPVQMCRAAAPSAAAEALTQERLPANLLRLEDGYLRHKAVEAALQIKEQGFAVVEGIIPSADADAYVDSLWAWLEGLGTGIRRSDPETWTEDAWPPVYRGILNTLEISHQDFVWKIRKHDRLVRMFELLLGTNELLTSFDAINLLGPHNEAPPAGWLHMDQAPVRSSCTCIQGIVNLIDIDPERTATLLVKPGSHKAHQEFFWRKSGLTEDELLQIPDHYQFTKEQLPFWDKFEERRLAAGKGAVFLWDSRTVHSNAAPPAVKDWRHVVYACFQPRSMASEHDLQLKRGAYENYQITTHLPAQNIRVYDEDFAKKYANEAKVSHLKLEYKTSRTRDRVEDAAMRRLAGTEAYPPSEVRAGRPLVDHSEQELHSMLQQP